jgi:glycosyltransferase involved in cell wall biosynthesis
MALRTPVVATTKGAEGLAVRHEEHLLIADTPAEFARATLRLLTDGGLRSRLADNAHRLVTTTYNWPVVMTHFERIAESVVVRA